MPSDSNYPDDIRRYDNDPRSPFYEEKPIICAVCGDKIEEGEDAIDVFYGWQHPRCYEKEIRG